MSLPWRASWFLVLLGSAGLLLAAPPEGPAAPEGHPSHEGAAAPGSVHAAPQTREEFVRSATAGERGMRMETLTVNRGFEAVYRTLAARTRPCLDVKVERAGYSGSQMEVSSLDYDPSLKRFGRDRAEFSLRVIHRARGVAVAPPQGGFHVMAADLRRAGPNRTEVVLYRTAMGSKEITKRFMQWASGKSAECPKMK
jgi:hypothetical protein